MTGAGFQELSGSVDYGYRKDLKTSRSQGTQGLDEPAQHRFQMAVVGGSGCFARCGTGREWGLRHAPGPVGAMAEGPSFAAALLSVRRFAVRGWVAPHIPISGISLRRPFSRINPGLRVALATATESKDCEEIGPVGFEPTTKGL